MSVPWSADENAAIITDYLDMLRKELKGEAFNKADRLRSLQPKLFGRSRGSIEFKRANISAALHDLGYGSIRGYKPRLNYQDSLLAALDAQLQQDAELRKLMSDQVESAPDSTPRITRLEELFVEPPRLDRPRSVYERRDPRAAMHTAESYLERESRNRRLGEAGELFVLEVEVRRLVAAGKKRLANKVEHRSKTVGDGLGYDILSFDERGSARFIEVKTTNFGEYTPFYASANEVHASAELAPHYSMYRVFDFRDSPRIFSLNGDLRRLVSLEPMSFRGSFR
jgi:hypothetical protein